MTQWYTKSSAQALQELDTNSSRGLTSTQAAQRLQQYGPNQLEKPKPTPLILRFLLQLKDPMIVVLLFAAALSLISTHGEDWIEAVIILLIVVVNAVISITQENSAHKALEALEQMSAPLARWCGTARPSAWTPASWCLGTSSCWRRGTWCPPMAAFYTVPT